MPDDILKAHIRKLSATDELSTMHNAVVQAIAAVRADVTGAAEGEDVEVPGGLVMAVLSYTAGRFIATAPADYRERAIQEFMELLRQHSEPTPAVTN